MSANEETVKKEVPEAQEAEETGKVEATQKTPEIEEKPVEKETEEQQRPVSRDGSDKDTVCALCSVHGRTHPGDVRCRRKRHFRLPPRY